MELGKANKLKTMSSRTRQSAHLQSYKDAELSQDEDDDSEFNFLTAEKSIDVDDAAHASNMNQLNFEKNDFDQLMYNDRAEANHVDASTEQFAAPSTPPRPSIKSRLGIRAPASGGIRGQQQPQQKNQGPIQKRGKGYLNNINKRNNRSNYNQNHVSAGFHHGLDVSFQQKVSSQLNERNANIGQLQNVLNSANDDFQNYNLGPNGSTFNANSNTNNLPFNSNNCMMLSHHMNTSNSNSYGGMNNQNNQGSGNLNSYGRMLQNNQGPGNSNSFGGMLQNNQGPGNSNSLGGMHQNNQGPGNSNSYGWQLQNNQGPGNSNSFGGQLQNNQGPGNSNSYGGQLQNNQGLGNSNSYGWQLQNNQGPGNSNSFGGQLQNNQGSVHSNSIGGMLHNNQRSINSNSFFGLLSNNQESGNSHSFDGMLQNNQGTANSSSVSGMFSNNPNITRPNIVANNWNSSVEMRSKSPININSRQNRWESSAKGQLEALLGSPAPPKSGMFVGEALGMSLSDCKTADIRKVTQNVLFLLATGENDSQTKPNYGVHNKNVPKQRHL
ncbi:probable cyclin-dependent serine/threonine-protein kinase DDB_G0292550 isoform X2 [Drosophila obscura]|uniref:probable cyclin-dependent serine/threonine-protein kinase DDB_G0292550 isoform X2 n=1 Tax=Drosophila obscura TaxID=7282 RepID=UPI001BB0FD82|nr:probable cyclin-dependent serine/threonine-protein kinase DDB_G0292550 isoform X2 [Drosophila obscura]